MKNWFCFYIGCCNVTVTLFVKRTVHGMGVHSVRVHDMGVHDVGVHVVRVINVGVHNMGVALLGRVQRGHPGVDVNQTIFLQR
jgi:hypothetical protein